MSFSVKDWLILIFVLNCNILLIQSAENFICGSTSMRNRRIIDGYRALENSSPWMGMIIKSSDESLVCGCTLIASKWVVTAAHCFRDPSTSGLLNEVQVQQNYLIKLGKIRLKPRKDDVRFRIKSLHIHPNYTRFFSLQSDKYTVNENDIALIELTDFASFSSSISPICLPPTNFTSSTNLTIGKVTGWGRINLNYESNALTLQEAYLPIVNSASCQHSFSQFLITDNMICAGFAKNYWPDTCEGDSGGPMSVQSIEDLKWYLIGIVSFGEGCSSTSYGIYTKVDKYIGWINKTINL